MPVLYPGASRTRSHTLSEYAADDIVKISATEAVRKRPVMYLGGTDTLGLHRSVELLLDEPFASARRGECGEIQVELRPEGGVSVFDSGPLVPRETLVQETRDEGLQLGFTRGWDLVVVCMLSSRFQVDQWEGGLQWRLRGERGVPSGLFHPVLPTEPVPGGASRGTRVDFMPDASLLDVTDFDPERLLGLCRRLAFLAPGLRVRFAAPARGLAFALHYPGGIRQRVAELTADHPRPHPEPLVFELWAGEVRVQCALQWSDSDGALLSFVNCMEPQAYGVRYGVPVEQLFRALRTAFVSLPGKGHLRGTHPRLKRGLTAILTTSTSDLFQHSRLRSLPDLSGAMARRLKPLLKQALKEHPGLSRFLTAPRASRSPRQDR